MCQLAYFTSSGPITHCELHNVDFNRFNVLAAHTWIPWLSDLHHGWDTIRARAWSCYKLDGSPKMTCRVGPKLHLDRRFNISNCCLGKFMKYVHFSWIALPLMALWALAYIGQGVTAQTGRWHGATASAPATLRSTQIPAGAEIHIPLSERVSSATALVSDTFAANSNEKFRLPDGTVLLGGYSGDGGSSVAEKPGGLFVHASSVYPSFHSAFRLFKHQILLVISMALVTSALWAVYLHMSAVGLIGQSVASRVAFYRTPPTAETVIYRCAKWIIGRVYSLDRSKRTVASGCQLVMPILSSTGPEQSRTGD